VDAEVTGDCGHRAAGLQHEPYAAVEQLLWVLAWSGQRDSSLPGTDSWFRSLRESQPGSVQFGGLGDDSLQGGSQADALDGGDGEDYCDGDDSFSAESSNDTAINCERTEGIP